MPPTLIALCLVAAAALAGCGGDDEGRDIQETSIADILNVTPAYTRKAVTTSGEATPVKELGFVLSDGEASIFVDVPPGLLRTVSPGEEVTVAGVVQKLPKSQGERLSTPRDVLLAPGDAATGASRAALAALRNTPTSVGDPFINAESVDGVDLKSSDDDGT